MLDLGGKHGFKWPNCKARRSEPGQGAGAVTLCPRAPDPLTGSLQSVFEILNHKAALDSLLTDAASGHDAHRPPSGLTSWSRHRRWTGVPGHKQTGVPHLATDHRPPVTGWEPSGVTSLRTPQIHAAAGAPRSSTPHAPALHQQLG